MIFMIPVTFEAVCREFTRADFERMLLADLNIPDELKRAYSGNPSFDQSNISWETLQAVRDKAPGMKNGLLLGKSGVGKTWAALATALSLVSFDASDAVVAEATKVTPSKSVFYAHAVELAQDKTQQDRAIKSDILIIDDLGCEAATGVKAQDFQAFLQYALHYRLGSDSQHTFTTSNLGFREFKARYGDRILNRFTRSGVGRDVSPVQLEIVS